MKLKEPFIDVYTRIHILKRDKYTCKKCGVKQLPHHKKFLQIHHIKKKSSRYGLGISLNYDNLITLCRRCHSNIHKKDKRKTPTKDKYGEPM